MDTEKDNIKEVFNLQFSQMREQIDTIAKDVKETKGDVKTLDKRVRDIEEMVRTKDTNDKIVSSRLDKLERITCITGFFTEHPNLLAVILIGILILSINSNWDILLNLFK